MPSNSICFPGGRLLRSAVLCLVLGVSVTAQALAAEYKIIVLAAPGGGWDQLGRATQQSLQAEKLVERIQVSNVPGGGGTIGLATLNNNHKGDGNALMAPPGITEAQRQELVKAVSQMVKSKTWKDILTKNEWLDLFMAGDEFKGYVESEQKNVLTLVTTLGLVKK